MIPYSIQVILALGLDAAAPTPCLHVLSSRALLPEPPVEILQYSVSKKPGFLRLLSLVAYTESRLRHGRVSGKGAHGILQITSIATADVVNRGLVLTNNKEIDNIRVGSAYLLHALRVTNGRVAHALAMYNAGYYGLTRIRRNETLPKETEAYIRNIGRLTTRHPVCHIPEVLNAEDY